VPKPLIGITAGFHPSNGGASRDQESLFLHPDYVEAVRVCGGEAVILPFSPPDPAWLLNRIDGMLVCGNDRTVSRYDDAPMLPTLQEQNPRRYESDARWIRGALRRHMPLLGICRGMQMINEVLGGRLNPQLFPDPDRDRHVQPLPGDQPWHPLEVVPESLLHRLLGAESVPVNSFHRQGIGLPAGAVAVTGRAGDGTIEVIEGSTGDFLLGVQFHPERLVKGDVRFLGLFFGLVDAARDYHRKNYPLRYGLGRYRLQRFRRPAEPRESDPTLGP
jgi:putative glutamine amidotransferase